MNKTQRIFLIHEARQELLRLADEFNPKPEGPSDPELTKVAEPSLEERVRPRISKVFEIIEGIEH